MTLDKTEYSMDLLDSLKGPLNTTFIDIDIIDI
jgi:hypothetical protein